MITSAFDDRDGVIWLDGDLRRSKRRPSNSSTGNESATGIYGHRVARQRADRVSGAGTSVHVVLLQKRSVAADSRYFGKRIGTDRPQSVIFVV